jgi:hypothetical protein
MQKKGERKMCDDSALNTPPPNPPTHHRRQCRGKSLTLTVICVLTVSASDRFTFFGMFYKQKHHAQYTLVHTKSTRDTSHDLRIH